MLAQGYAQLGLQQTNIEIEKRNATLKSQSAFDQVRYRLPTVPLQPLGRDLPRRVPHPRTCQPPWLLARSRRAFDYLERPHFMLQTETVTESASLQPPLYLYPVVVPPVPVAPPPATRPEYSMFGQTGRGPLNMPKPGHGPPRYPSANQGNSGSQPGQGPSGGPRGDLPMIQRPWGIGSNENFFWTTQRTTSWTGGGGDYGGGGGPPGNSYPSQPTSDAARRSLARQVMTDARKYALKLDNVDQTIPRAFPFPVRRATRKQ
ncbi:hypothetical protein H257_12096 [Aphanomyces astaci]|uniref:Uncharacterized protein n=1 Tax=Aphanomyces astaci TaxID=112090 RepID=W4G059_APHAT|nr:hypothetical protein H257_12096 [Aphanomyces astaci]ETV73060.1 hypothetical protein H257_12096 [Aphanomyces astaci]|eukprot:XP_009837509.1 hypothetical protein H257_12096 [Aphanomyces astaci]